MYPKELATMRSKEFIATILTPNLERLRLYFSEVDIDAIDQDHRILFFASICVVDGVSVAFIFVRLDHRCR